MPLFGSEPAVTDRFKRNEVVVASEKLRGVPEGTRGKIKLINGFDWIRYWVFFENGVQLGSIGQDQLVRPQHWRQFQADRERIIREAEEAKLLSASASTNAGSNAETAVAAADPNDPLAAVRAMVPPHLIERSASARTRVGIPKP